MKHQINSIGNSGIRNAVIHIRKMQIDNPICFYIKPLHGSLFLSSVIIEETPPMWYELAVAVEPGSLPKYMYGSDSMHHNNMSEYIKWIKYLIDIGGIDW